MGVGFLIMMKWSMGGRGESWNLCIVVFDYWEYYLILYVDLVLFCFLFFFFF